jgi:hypothetical protein
LFRHLTGRQSAIFGPQSGHVSDIAGLLRWKWFEPALGPQQDHRLAVVVFGPGLHLIAREFEGDVAGLVTGPRKAQRSPVHGDLAAADTEKTAEVDDRRVDLPDSIENEGLSTGESHAIGCQRRPTSTPHAEVNAPKPLWFPTDPLARGCSGGSGFDRGAV